MNLVLSAKHVLMALGVCAGLAACGDGSTQTPTTKTFAQVVTDMKTSCVPCHTAGSGTALTKFVIQTDNAATYTQLMSKSLINKSAPDMSSLIQAGRGLVMAGGAQHPMQLSSAKATEWIAWITAGANNN